MSRSNCCNGSEAALSSFSSVDNALGRLRLFQKPSAPIFSSSSFRPPELAGKSKRVADGNIRAARDSMDWERFSWIM
jgi:hypothetical protein